MCITMSNTFSPPAHGSAVSQCFVPLPACHKRNQSLPLKAQAPTTEHMSAFAGASVYKEVKGVYKEVKNLYKSHWVLAHVFGCICN